MRISSLDDWNTAAHDAEYFPGASGDGGENPCNTVAVAGQTKSLE